MKRASETPRSTFFRQYRSFVCAAAVAAFAVCMSPSAFAQTTYYPSSVSCLSGGNYQPPEEDPVNPSLDGEAQLVAESTSSTVYKVSCTWSFPHVQIPSAATLHVEVDYGSSVGSGPNGNHCIGGSAFVFGGYIDWHKSCNSGEVFETGDISAGTWLDTLHLTGEVQTSSTNPAGTDDEADLFISTIAIY